jgi:hypothetical protein
LKKYQNGTPKNSFFVFFGIAPKNKNSHIAYDITNLEEIQRISSDKLFQCNLFEKYTPKNWVNQKFYNESRKINNNIPFSKFDDIVDIPNYKLNSQKNDDKIKNRKRENE